MNPRISIRNNKARSKFCACMNRVFGCRDVYLCGVACPLHLWAEVLRLQDEKNLHLGEAFRLCLRASIEKEDGRKIIREALEKKEKVYPSTGWQEKVEK